MRFSRRRGFTIMELVFVIVILGVLAAIAIVLYSAVTNRAKDASVQESAHSYYREYLADDGFDGVTAPIGSASSRAVMDEIIAAGDAPANGATTGYCPASGVSVAAPVDASTRVEITKSGRIAILDLATGIVTVGASPCS